MLRLTEAALFVLPFVAFLAWRLSGRGGRLSLRLVAIAALWVVLLALGLAWFGLRRTLPPGTAYVPARIGADGRIVEPESTQ
ncbi:MAG TPA: hypothetical protein VJ779_08455 [Acetobacteraceae bacterium]|nr:hypothetical protein [Acetobacteraceae bacterium]